jgi:hypothetical protein
MKAKKMDQTQIVKVRSCASPSFEVS